MRIPDPVLGAEAWLLENGHRSLLKLTGGRFPRKMGGMKTVELHTTGRKSGKAYSTMLTTPVHDEQRIVLVASKGGSQDHPDWYKNLVANPDVLLTLDDRTVPMRARTASPDERGHCGRRWWPRTRATPAISATPTGRSPSSSVSHVPSVGLWHLGTRVLRLGDGASGGQTRRLAGTLACKCRPRLAVCRCSTAPLALAQNRHFSVAGIHAHGALR